MEGLFVVFLLAWNCGVVWTNSTQLPPTTSNESLQCGVDLNDYDYYWDDYINVYRNNCIGYGCEGWYNYTLQGGRRQISTFNNLPSRCKYMLEWDWVVIVALKDEHPNILTIGEEIQTLPGCAVNNTNMECLFDVDVMVKKCDGDLIYYLKYHNITFSYYYYVDNIYCFECDTPLGTPYYYHEHASDDFLLVETSDRKWYNFNVDGIQYVIPSVEDLQFLDWDVFMEDLDYIHYYPWLLAVDGDRAYWTQLDGNVQSFRLCEYYIYDYIDGYDNFTCNYYYYDDIYVSKCNDGIRYHLPYHYWPLYVVNANINRPIVMPELVHEPVVSNIEGTLTSAYQPVIQFRCSFTINSTELYTVNWYIDDILVATRGPSNVEDELLLKETELQPIKLGFNIKCSYKITTVANETFSEDYYAGIKILDTDIRLSRRGSEIIRAKLTVPMGCLHAAFEDTPCSQPLILYDPNKDDEECDGEVSVTNGAGDKCYEEIQTLKFGETWDPNKIYRFIVTTVEHTYDDRTDFNLSISVPGTVSHSIWQGYNQNGVKVQESTMYCFGDSGPVCACGIAVRAGQDVFMIDRCGDVNYLDFPYCGDGGLLDVQVVTTPIGTKIIIYFTWGKFMNTDIIMSAKDFGNTRGLCGYFDNDRQNDFTLSNGTVTGNDHELFAETWRLSDEMNLFTNSERELGKWSENNTISCLCSSDGYCEEGKISGCQKASSITQTKCGLHGNRRKKRSVVRDRRGIRKHMKRSVNNEISNITATQMCNESIYNSPALRDFDNMLGDEDPNEVIKQCVFDTMASNDTRFVTMYETAINNVAKNFIDQNPVFAANNTEAVDKFNKKTCLNNCSGNGECSIKGQCQCQDVYRGPDCSYDFRIPPIIQVIDDNQCDIANDNPCDCFIVRTDNIFDGYSFSLKTTKIHFDGKHTPAGDFVNTGIREDIYTGMVCLPNIRTRRDVQQISDYVLSYDIALSNDGISFGTARTVVIYDSTCHNITKDGDLVIVNLKDGYCYITGACIPDGYEDGCRLCNSNVMPFEWSLVNCEDGPEISIGIIIGIVVGCTVIVLIVITVLVYTMYRKSRKIRVQPNGVNVISSDCPVRTHFKN
ncbi:hypothetical protein ACF0H5_004706 [Mactra antiquata]